jgi:hypothetical protein
MCRMRLCNPDGPSQGKPRARRQLSSGRARGPGASPAGSAGIPLRRRATRYLTDWRFPPRRASRRRGWGGVGLRRKFPAELCALGSDPRATGACQRTRECPPSITAPSLGHGPSDAGADHGQITGLDRFRQHRPSFSNRRLGGRLLPACGSPARYRAVRPHGASPRAHLSRAARQCDRKMPVNPATSSDPNIKPIMVWPHL